VIDYRSHPDGADFWNITEADYDAVLNINLKGTFFTTQAFVQHLIETKRTGKIITSVLPTRKWRSLTSRPTGLVAKLIQQCAEHNSSPQFFEQIEQQGRLVFNLN
jgi:NAD(P)-dependent dehydrogenase (short-subunit alcohol dehydrogenase family)